VIPGAVVASILQRDFASMAITRTETGGRPVVIAGPTRLVTAAVLIVDETCDTGATMKLASTPCASSSPPPSRPRLVPHGPFQPDFYALETENFIILPWDRESSSMGDRDAADYAAKLKELGG